MSGGGSSSDEVDTDVMDGLGGEGGVGVSPAVCLAGSTGNDAEDGSPSGVALDGAGITGSNGSNGSSDGSDGSDGSDDSGGERRRDLRHDGALPPRLSGRSPSSYTELDTMMEHMIPNLGHFPRSDASVAFALNELDTLLSDEVC